MFAIIKTGGKQYRVEPNTLVRVEKLDAEIGNQVTLNEILMINNGNNTMIGNPLLSKAEVVAEVVDNFKGDKIIIFKQKRRKNYRRKNGHRQNYTLLKIKEIKVA
jgi:large subunit ribosomal protein L21